jgi:hypothetical protein
MERNALPEGAGIYVTLESSVAIEIKAELTA